MNEDTFYPPGPHEALEWIAALCAAGLDYRLSRNPQGAWQVHVPKSQSAKAWNQICAIESERLAPPSAIPTPAPRQTPAADHPTRSWTALWAAYALVLFYYWTGPYDDNLPLIQAGAAHAGRITQGEWWRNITALTLHSGIAHLLANIFFLIAMGQAVIQAFGRGTGLLLILAGGIAGNAITALVVPPDHTSVGASTMCFAALGIMSTWQTTIAFRRWRRLRAVWKRIWLPLAAGLALLGIMGTGEQSDLAAHAFGFAAGAMLSLPLCIRTAPRQQNPALEWTLVALTALIPLMAWAMAIASIL